ncbi:MAG: UDP-2,3-diacylglucosamine diphosphatase [Pseudomonadales bacterium]|nr:UDP-2,3-diacylglucosamine diphosphatase [Pseudomonadales bacterium]
MTIRIISDLHLDEKNPALCRAFFIYLDNLPKDTQSLYILGDFFEAWVGDDDDLPFHDDIRQRLKQLTDSGITLFFQHGNRDFLVGELFAKQTGCTLLPEAYVLYTGTQKIAILHGDSLCIDDVEYQQFRAQMRNPDVQKMLLSQTLDERRALAQSLRDNSKEANSNKAENIMDINQAELEKVMRQLDVQILIHGHTHRPQKHQFNIDDKACERIVLGDWGKTGWEIVLDDNQISLNEFKL